MAAITQIQVYLNGAFTEHVKGLDDLEIDSSFISDSRTANVVQPILTVNELTFVGPAARQIINYQLGGLDGSTVGILEGMPLQLYANNGINSVLIFDGYIDFTDYEEIHAAEVVCKITENKSMASFDVISRVTFFNILKEKGVYSSADYTRVKYIIEKLDLGSEATSVALAIYILSVQIQQQARTAAYSIANAVAIAVGGFTGPAAAIIYAFSLAAIDLLIFIKLVNELVKLINKLAKLLVPPVRRHAGILQHTLLEKAINHLGLDFNSNIDLLKKVVYLPARPSEVADITVGTPKLGQAGETLAEFIAIVLNMYYAKFAIIDNVVHIHAANDPFWQKNSSYILPDVGDDDPNATNLTSERVLYNIGDFVGNRKIRFADDVSDEHTGNEWKGTNFMVIAEPINVNDQNNLLLNGLEEVNIPCALGKRKSELNIVEGALKELFGIADRLASIFGGNKNFSSLITNRFGALKLSQTVFNTPKFIYMEGGEIPLNQINFFSARILYERFHAYKSFVNRNPVLTFVNEDGSAATYKDTAPADFGNQKQLFNEFLVRFNMDDYLQVKNNSYFAMANGTPGEIEKSKWLIRQAKAQHTFSIEKIWTKNLKETFIEPI